MDPKNRDMKELIDLYAEVNSEEENDAEEEDEEKEIIDKDGIKLKKNKDGEYWCVDSDDDEDK